MVVMVPIVMVAINDLRIPILLVVGLGDSNGKMLQRKLSLRAEEGRYITPMTNE